MVLCGHPMLTKVSIAKMLTRASLVRDRSKCTQNCVAPDKNMEIVIIIGTLATLILGIAVVLLLRTFFTSCVSYAETLELGNVSWKDYRPIQRLLDPKDFDYLRRKGISEARIESLMEERRRIFRICLRSLAHDFNQVHQTLALILVQSRTDRPELAAELAKQKVLFYRQLMFVEFRLALNSCGISRMPAIDLLGPLDALQSQLRELCPAGSAAGY